MTATTKAIRLPAPLPHQRDLLRSRSSRQLLVAGVGGGKTHTLVLWALRRALVQPGVPGAIFAPTYRLFQRVVLPTWRELVPKNLYHFRPGDQLIELINGTRITCMGTDRAAERVVGMNLGWAAMDEAGVSRDAMAAKMIMQRIRVGSPVERALGLFTSPRGHPWLKDWSENSAHVVRATTYDNPFLPASYIADLEIDFPPGSMLHRQEMLGEFVIATGLVYEAFSRDVHLVDTRDEYDASYDLGWDPGARASGVVAVQVRAPGVHTVVAEWTPTGEYTDDTARRILADMGRPPRRIYLDTPSKLNTRTGITDVEALAAVFPRADIKVLGGRMRSSEYRHRAVSSAFRRRLLAISSDLVPIRASAEERGLVSSLESLAWADASTRSERVDDRTAQKHIVDALEFYVAAAIPQRYGDPADRRDALKDAA